MSMQHQPFSPPSAVPGEPGEAASCRRCGTCCLRGGPTLMLSDTALLVSGALTLESLVCLRAGEWARDDSRKALRPLEGERIKIAGPGGRVHPWRCLYYREGVGCGIYAQRPAQCEALFCMDTGPLEVLLAKGRHMGRFAALNALKGGIPGFSGLSAAVIGLLPDLVSAHEEQVSVRETLELADRLGFYPAQGHGLAVERSANHEIPFEGSEREQAVAELGEAARTDAAFRELCVERAGIPAAMLPFLLGRSIKDLLAEVGLKPAQGK